MRPGVSRRSFFKAAGAVALAPRVAQPAAAPRDWPPAEREGVPRLCLGIDSNADAKRMRKLQQIGVDHVLMRGPPIPWTDAALRERMERFAEGGLRVSNMMIGGSTDTLYGRPGRDDEIDKVVQSIRAAGNVGLPIIEYNFYAHRLMGGYHEELGRGGAGMTAHDYERSKDDPPLPEIGTHSLADMWRNITYFLEAVVPAAEKAGVCSRPRARGDHASRPSRTQKSRPRRPPSPTERGRGADTARGQSCWRAPSPWTSSAERSGGSSSSTAP